MTERPIEIAIVGGGCASMAAAFELTRPELEGKYRVTIYQLGWRLGGKGASGRGPCGRIEEHGLHVWMGFYENAFRLLRECYEELGRDQSSPIATWRDAFFPDPFVGVADRGKDGQWLHRTASFPAADGLPGDPLTEKNPFTLKSYLGHTLALLRTLLMGVNTERPQRAAQPAGAETGPQDGPPLTSPEIEARIDELFRFSVLTTITGLIAAVGLLSVIVRLLPDYSERLVLDLLRRVAGGVRHQLDRLTDADEALRYQWEIIDLVIAIMVGIIDDGLLSHPKGLDAIDHHECTQWLIDHGAAPESARSAFVRGLHDLAFAYGPDGPQPGIAAGQAIRGSLRMLFTYRGAIFWKMRAGMGDVVFAPFYEVLSRRGVRFEFFHRLCNVSIAEPEAADESPHVDALEFEVQAKIKHGREYRPLIDVNGVPSWPSAPDYEQLVGAARLRKEKRQFESDWDRRHETTRTLEVGKDFDMVVLGVGVGEIPEVCREILARDERWRTMVEHVTTTETQAFQLWLDADMESLGWKHEPVNISGYVNPFNTWADMRQLIPMESWRNPPQAIAYFCNALPDDPELDRTDPTYPATRHEQVKNAAIRFLNRDIDMLWPEATGPGGSFRWDLLADCTGSLPPTGEIRFESQFWTANVNRSDRYVLAPPGSLEHRISPLDYSYDNLTIAGDWTDCGFNEGCVEAAVMSGRLAAHAIALQPALEDIVGYDHP